MLTKDYVLDLLEYRRLTGDFVWRRARGCRAAGSVAGTNSSSCGYSQIKIDKRFYLTHQLVWLVEHGVWPQHLDHIDGDTFNNRIYNLRPCSMSQNKANSRRYKNNKSGIKGVSPSRGKWVATIQHLGRKKHLGRFKHKEDAARAYWVAARKTFGEFARSD